MQKKLTEFDHCRDEGASKEMYPKKHLSRQTVRSNSTQSYVLGRSPDCRRCLLEDTNKAVFTSSSHNVECSRQAVIKVVVDVLLFCYLP